jgi:diacylglycerol kinase (ATP)
MTNKFSSKARLKSFAYAFKGLSYFFRTQHNTWIQLVIAAVAVALGFYLHISSSEWCWISASIGFVLVAELFNTAIETLTDLVSPVFNEKAGRVKDVAAGAVLIASLTAAVIGAIIFIPKIF